MFGRRQRRRKVAHRQGLAQTHTEQLTEHLRTRPRDFSPFFCAILPVVFVSVCLRSCVSVLVQVGGTQAERSEHFGEMFAAFVRRHFISKQIEPIFVFVSE